MKKENEILNKIFDNLENWRKLPKYQLERRLDIFLTPYLKDILANKFADVAFHNLIIPEFPVNVNFVNAFVKSNKANANREYCFNSLNDKKIKQQSFNIDYLMFSADKTIAYFIELKTDDISYNDEQKTRMLIARDNYTFNELLIGLKSIYNRTKSKEKYDVLVDMLFENKDDFYKNDTYNLPICKIEIIYLLPNAPKDIDINENIEFVTFDRIAKCIDTDNFVGEKLKSILDDIYADSRK